jgi:hypothetical protein
LASWGGKRDHVYISGIVALLLLIFAVLLMVGVVPLSNLVVGAMFVAVCCGFAGPYIIRT